MSHTKADCRDQEKSSPESTKRSHWILNCAVQHPYQQVVSMASMETRRLITYPIEIAAEGPTLQVVPSKDTLRDDWSMASTINRTS